MFYTYLHLRESDNKPFYIGKGRGRRAWSHTSRNRKWESTVQKHGLKVEILAEWSVEQEAFEHEKFLISCFRDMGHELSNMTDGGEGVSDSSGKVGKKISKTYSLKSKEEKDQRSKKISSKLHDHFLIKENREYRSQSLKKSHCRPEVVNKISSIVATAWKNSEITTRRLASMRSKDVCESKSKTMSQKKWVNNGSINQRVNKDTPLPEGFVLGRLKKAKNGA